MFIDYVFYPALRTQTHTHIHADERHFHAAEIYEYIIYSI